jgi:hypothetical protein
MIDLPFVEQVQQIICDRPEDCNCFLESQTQRTHTSSASVVSPANVGALFNTDESKETIHNDENTKKLLMKKSTVADNDWINAFDLEKDFGWPQTSTSSSPAQEAHLAVSSNIFLKNGWKDTFFSDDSETKTSSVKKRRTHQSTMNITKSSMSSSFFVKNSSNSTKKSRLEPSDAGVAEAKSHQQK